MLASLVSFSLLVLTERTLGSPHSVNPNARPTVFSTLADQVSGPDSPLPYEPSQSDHVYEYVTHASFGDYSLRVADPESPFCDPAVKRHTGYLDVTGGKHLFFWFFESRKSPEKAPLTLWMNGGPGGSSSIGLFFELGPCTITDEGKRIIPNPYSWNTYSNIIFIDQPVGVGYSYSDDGSEVDSSPTAAEDVYAFLQLFLERYPEYADAPLHVAAESYGGMYGPRIGAGIHKRNKALAESPAPAQGKQPKHLNLASIILANGHTDPKIQFASIPDYVCNGPYAVLEPDGPECTAWRQKVPTCERLIQTCYDFDTSLACTPADSYCWNEVWKPIAQINRNPYDIRLPCNVKEYPNGCYDEFSWVEKWLNSTSTKKAIGVDPSISFEIISGAVNRAFHRRGDTVHNSAVLLPELINDGVRLLIYAGMTDVACNYIGNEAWLTQLENKFHAEFKNSTFVPWITIESGVNAGEIRYAGGGGTTAGNVTFVKVYDAGHMVSYDKPEAALDLFTRWIFDVPLYFEKARYTSLGELVY